MVPTDLRARLHGTPPPAPAEASALASHGDHQFSPDLPIDFPVDVPKPAAVLVPIIDRRPEPTVLFTRRAIHLKNHSGQIAFPGGRIDADDDGPLAAALREAWEEIGLPSELVEPLGYLDLYQSTSGYQITPVVGLVPPDLPLEPNPDEVDAVFEVPLAFLLDERNHRFDSRFFRGRERRYVAIPFGPHYIWGVTAGILRNLRERVLR